MVGYGVLVPDAQAPGHAKRFDQMEDGRWQMAEGWWGRFLPPQGGLCSLTAFREAARTPTPDFLLSILRIEGGGGYGLVRMRSAECGIGD